MNLEWGSLILQALVAALLSSSVIAVLVGAILRRRTEQISAEVRRQVEQDLLGYRSTIKWKEQALSELLGPVVMQLERTGRAFKYWKSKNLYLEAKIVREGNMTIRDLLLEKGHLIPEDLQTDAARLVEHYDRWLEEYDRVRGGVEPQLDKPFVFVGPKGFPFPRDAEQRFKERFRQIWNELYGVGSQTP